MTEHRSPPRGGAPEPPRLPAPGPAPVPGRYPEELVAVVTARDGVALVIRPIRPDDGPALAEFHQRLSPRSVYRRFFFVHPRLSEAEVEGFTCVDYVDRLALVAEDGGRLAAVGRYDRGPGTSDAEVAFVVDDDHQHHGIGTMLLERLAAAAWRCGITSFSARTLVENRAMLRVFVDSGFPVTTAYEEGAIVVHFPIRPDAAYRAAREDRARRDRAADPGDRPGSPGHAPC